MKMKIATPAQKNGKGFDAGLPSRAKTTGMKGGFPGVSPDNGSKTGNPVGSMAMGHKGSGHDAGETRRAVSTGYGKGK